MLALAALTGCSGGARNQAPPQTASAPNTAEQSRDAGAASGESSMKTVSLQQADDATTANVPTPAERRIIRNATITLEVEQPTQAMQVIASIAESRGGFVVTSDSVRHSVKRGTKSYEVVTVEIRVPAAQFDAALATIRGINGGNVTAQKITGKDVTEEYIDLEARLRTQKALEAQLMEIMKRAAEVEDAIAVQRELTNVRTEIERVEGRRRFLENQSSLSTISVTLQPPAPLVSTTGFFQSVGGAFGDGIDFAASFILFLISVSLPLLVVAIFIGLPAYFILRYLARRVRSRPAPPQPPQPVQEFYPQPPPNA
jgi:hypothetical protein